jgi:mono/diheme cytochrome c family protein
MSKSPFVIFGALIAVVAVIGYVAFAKEGSDEAVAVPVEQADEAAKDSFNTNCGTCHTLAAGGTDGVVGPNLDELIGGTPASEEPSADDKLTAFSSNYSRVLQAVTCGQEGRMPTGILQGTDAEEVAAFVAAYAGQLGEDEGPLVPADDRPTPPAEPCTASGTTG